MQLLNEFQIAPGQLVPNAWRTIISCMSIWMSACNGEMISLNEFLFLYHLKASTHYGYFKLLPWDRKSRVVRDKYRHRVHVALAYAHEVEDFDNLVDPCHLYDCCIGPKPSKYVLEKICWEQKKMATRYSKNKYAHIKNLKDEPLANLTSDSKKRKLSDEKANTSALPFVHTTPPSPTSSLEVTVVTPPLTRAKGKSKVGMSVWDDPVTTLGHAHNVITSDELKGLSSVPSHELVNRHIHKLVLGESFCIMIDYLNVEEKVMMATSKAESVEVECSQLKNDLIVAMNERNEVNQKIKELTKALRVEKALVAQKDEDIQATLLKTDDERDKIIQKFKQLEEFSDLQFMQYFKGFEHLRQWMMKHPSLAIDFSSLDFEKIDMEILEDEAKEQDKTESSAMEKDKVAEKDTDESTVPTS
nr:hypothetical protein CFP56_34191 [Quercus suber]